MQGGEQGETANFSSIVEDELRTLLVLSLHYRVSLRTAQHQYAVINAQRMISLCLALAIRVAQAILQGRAVHHDDRDKHHESPQG